MNYILEVFAGENDMHHPVVVGCVPFLAVFLEIQQQICLFADFNR